MCPRPCSAAEDSWDYRDALAPRPQPGCRAAHASPARGKPRLLPGQSRDLPSVRPLSKEGVSWKKAHTPHRRASSGVRVLNLPRHTLKASNGIQWILKYEIARNKSPQTTGVFINWDPHKNTGRVREVPQSPPLTTPWFKLLRAF